MLDQKDCAIIIPHADLNQGTRYSIEQCLISLNETVPEMKIIVAQNKNCTTLPKTINQKNITCIYLQEQGQCKATNAAVATVNTPWVFVTNNDMVYAPGWWEKLTQPIGSEFATYCVSPKLIEPIDGAPTFEKYFCGGAGGDFDKQKFLAFAQEYYLRPEQTLRTGFNLPFMIKKELWDLIGGYDINYDPWGSNGDSDLQAKIHLAGVQPFQSELSLVYHFSGASSTFHPDNHSYWEKNMAYFREKWGFERQSAPLVWQSQEIIDQKLLKYQPFWVGHYGTIK
jgi:GT2 family glycosyltransferase